MVKEKFEKKRYTHKEIDKGVEYIKGSEKIIITTDQIASLKFDFSKNRWIGNDFPQGIMDLVIEQAKELQA